MQNRSSDADITALVKERYGAMARQDSECRRRATRELAEAFGYSTDQLSAIPTDANLGVSCGNPTAMASLKPGEVVVDLGCGAGLDVLLAAQKVGPTGKAIGVDMTEPMLARARRNAEQAGFANVEFHLAQIEDMPLADKIADCVISNCVLNLVPDKARAFAEIFRVLRPGGRLAISDIALKQPLPDELAKDWYAYIGCVAGAILIDDYRAGLETSGFGAIEVVDGGLDLNVYARLGNPSCCGAANEADDLFRRFQELIRRFDINQYAAGVKVFAVKPV